MRNSRLLLAACLACCLSSCWLLSEDEVHLLPEGYTGPVFVIFGAENAQSLPKRDGARVFHIPESGVLRTKSRLQEGYRQIDFYYVDGNGSRRQLPDFYLREETPGDSVGIITMQAGGGEDLQFLRYIVGRPSNKAELYDQMMAVSIDSLAQTE